jgi:hypothetical protein
MPYTSSSLLRISGAFDPCGTAARTAVAGNQFALFYIKAHFLVFNPLVEIMPTQGFTLVFLAGFGLFKCYDIGHAVLWRFRIACTSLRQGRTKGRRE